MQVFNISFMSISYLFLFLWIWFRAEVVFLFSLGTQNLTLFLVPQNIAVVRFSVSLCFLITKEHCGANVLLYLN